MPRYAVTDEHPDERDWRQHLQPHVGWLQDRLAKGSLIASGPFRTTPAESRC